MQSVFIVLLGLGLAVVFWLIRNIFFLIILLPLLVSVACLTLIERKLMGTIQRRQGPHRVGFWGFLQPFADGLKLLIKEPIIPQHANKLIFILSPILFLTLSLSLWMVMPFGYNISFMRIPYSVLLIICLSSFSVYAVILAGWSSNSKYAFLGGLRSAAQMIAYEVSFILILLPIIAYAQSYDLMTILNIQKILGPNIYLFFPLFILCIISTLAETNRAPFDLPEAESELVSGYNVEYSGFGFAFFFIGEYLNIIFMSCLMTVLFFGGTAPLFGELYFTIIPGVEFLPTLGDLWSASVWGQPTPPYTAEQLAERIHPIKIVYILKTNIFLLMLVYFFSIVFAIFNLQFLRLFKSLSMHDLSALVIDFLENNLIYVNFFFQPSFIWYLIKVCFMLWLFIAIRAIVPRYRYDQLMILGWKNILPIAIFFFIFYISLFFALSHMDCDIDNACYIITGNSYIK